MTQNHPDPEPDPTINNIFHDAPFVARLGLQLQSIGPGQCVTILDITPQHLQQNGYIHAGVQATMADHTAGAAATTLIQGDGYVLTAEFKISLLRAAQGQRLICRAQVLKSGRRLTFVESELYCLADGRERLVSKASATMAVVTPR